MLKPSYYSLFNITLHNDYQHYTQKKQINYSTKILIFFKPPLFFYKKSLSQCFFPSGKNAMDLRVGLILYRHIGKFSYRVYFI